MYKNNVNNLNFKSLNIFIIISKLHVDKEVCIWNGPNLALFSCATSCKKTYSQKKQYACVVMLSKFCNWLMSLWYIFFHWTNCPLTYEKKNVNMYA